MSNNTINQLQSNLSQAQEALRQWEYQEGDVADYEVHILKRKCSELRAAIDAAIAARAEGGAA